MIHRNMLVGGGTLSARWRQLHRARRSNMEEGLKSSVFDGIWPYRTGEIRAELGGDQGGFQGSSSSGDFSCSGGEAWGSSSRGQLDGESGAIMGHQRQACEESSNGFWFFQVSPGGDFNGMSLVCGARSPQTKSYLF
jgi:hypothetical protein